MTICEFQTDFRTLFLAGRTAIICGFQINFRTLFMAGRTTIICGFQTNFRTLFMAGRTTIICGFQTIFRLCLWPEEQRLSVNSKPISAHCLWREEQRLFVDSKPFSACVYGGKNNHYLWIPNHFLLLSMAGRTTIISGFQTIFRLCLWREEQRLLVDSKPISAHFLLREEQ